MDIKLYNYYDCLSYIGDIDYTEPETFGESIEINASNQNNDDIHYTKISSRGIYFYQTQEDVMSNNYCQYARVTDSGSKAWYLSRQIYFRTDLNLDKEELYTFIDKHFQKIDPPENIVYKFDDGYLNCYHSGTMDFPRGIPYIELEIYIDSPVFWNHEEPSTARLSEDGTLLWWDSEHYLMSDLSKYRMWGYFAYGEFCGLRLHGDDIGDARLQTFFNQFSVAMGSQTTRTTRINGDEIIASMSERALLDSTGNNISDTFEYIWESMDEIQRRLPNAPFSPSIKGAVDVGVSDTEWWEPITGSVEAPQTGYAYKEIDKKNLNNTLIDEKTVFDKESQVFITDDVYIWTNKSPKMAADIQVGKQYIVKYTDKDCDGVFRYETAFTMPNPIDESEQVVALDLFGAYYVKQAHYGDYEFNDIVATNRPTDAQIYVFPATILEFQSNPLIPDILEDGVSVVAGLTPGLFDDFSMDKVYNVYFSWNDDTEAGEPIYECSSYIPIEIYNPFGDYETIQSLARLEDIKSLEDGSSATSRAIYIKQFNFDGRMIKDAWVFLSQSFDPNNICDKIFGWTSSYPKYNKFDNNYIDEKYFLPRKDIEGTVKITYESVSEQTDTDKTLFTYVSPQIDIDEWNKIIGSKTSKIEINDFYLTLQSKDATMSLYSASVMQPDGFKYDTYVSISPEGVVALALTIRTSIIPIPNNYPTITEDGDLVFDNAPEVTDDGELIIEGDSHVTNYGSLIFE